MPRLIWSPDALGDNARLHGFLAQKNRDAAKRAVAAIRRGVTLLGEHPETGRLIDEMPTEYRQWPISFGHSGNITVYRFDDNEVIILAVRHGKEAGF
jgi:plasmid stabilization system protein ParE